MHVSFKFQQTEGGEFLNPLMNESYSTVLAILSLIFLFNIFSVDLN